MGQKIHPVGLRLGIIRGHDSHWICPKRQYRDLLVPLVRDAVRSVDPAARRIDVDVDFLGAGQ